MKHKKLHRGRKSHDLREGRLSLHARGFGFVLCEPGPDVFVPPAALGTAMHGDLVRVQVAKGPKGLDGRVVEIKERGTHYVGGELRMSKSGAFVEPDDDRIKGVVRVTGKLPAHAKSGLGVIAKIVAYPGEPGEPLRARIVESFGASELVAFELRRIMLSHGVREEFPEDVAAEARAFGGKLSASDYAGREDLRALPLLTIDPEDARDHDDAVWAERLPDGYRVVVAIADVSHYVPVGSALDREALLRGCTIYLPGRAIPMLPAELSSELASLLPHQDRLTLAVEATLDREGAVRQHRFIEGVMRSAGKLSYGAVARALGLSQAPSRDPEADAREPLLRTLLDVARLLGARRKQRGSLDFDLPEAKVKLDHETGEPIDVERTRKDPGVRGAYNLIEELMLLANEVVAADLSRRKLTAIYRVHGTPSEEKVVAFAELARSLGFDIDEDAARHPGKLASLLGTVAGTPHAELLSYLLLRAMQQATYATENIGHFGLAATDYVHFTSPIRRYPDLAVHRIVRRLARGAHVPRDAGRGLALQATESSRLERRAMLIEREVSDLYRARLMQKHVGEVFDATITGITEHGIFAALDAPYVDVFCRTESLFADRYQIDRYGTRMFGLHSGKSYALFDQLRVRIEEVSIGRRRISAVPVLGEDLAEQVATRERERPRPKQPPKPKQQGRGRRRDRGRRR